MKYTMLLLLCVFFASCGGYNTGVVQKAEKSQIKFVGNVLNAQVSIDDGEMMTLDAADVVYNVKAGAHTVKIYKNFQLIMNRTIVTDNGIITELEIQ